MANNNPSNNNSNSSKQNDGDGMMMPLRHLALRTGTLLPMQHLCEVLQMMRHQWQKAADGIWQRQQQGLAVAGIKHLCKRTLTPPHQQRLPDGTKPPLQVIWQAPLQAKSARGGMRPPLQAEEPHLWLAQMACQPRPPIWVR